MVKTILILSNTPDNIPIFRKKMVIGFLKFGYKVVVLSSQITNNLVSSFYSENGIEYIEAPLSRNGLNYRNDEHYKKAIEKAIADKQPSFIFSIAAKPNIYGGIIAEKYNIPFYPLLCGLGSIFRSNSLKTLLIRPFFAHLYKKSLRHASKIFLHNNDDLKYLIKKHIIKDEDRCVVLGGSGVDIDLFAKSTIPIFPSFIFVGRLIRDKGIIEFIKSVEKLNKKYGYIEAAVVGGFDSNPSSIDSKTFFRILNNTTIKYFGTISNIKEIVSQYGVFVLPSYHEGMPKSTLEALSLGRIIITTDAPGCRETVIDGYNGFLVKPKSLNSLYSIMEKVFLHYKDFSYMSSNSRTMAENKFDEEKVNQVIYDSMGLKKIC